MKQFFSCQLKLKLCMASLTLGCIFIHVEYHRRCNKHRLVIVDVFHLHIKSQFLVQQFICKLVVDVKLDLWREDFVI